MDAYTDIISRLELSYTARLAMHGLLAEELRPDMRVWSLTESLDPLWIAACSCL